jgi:hypothetical protein
MALNNHDQAQLREYLLGKLTEPEQEKIEERLMIEDDFFEEFEVSKDELVDEYCAGTLENAERQWFEEHFLVTEEGRQRRAFALAMDCLQHPQSVPVSVVPQPSFFAQLAALFKRQPWAIATVASLVLVVGVVFVATRSRSRSQGQTFAATLGSQNLVRGEQGVLPAKIKLPPDTSTLKLRVQLPKAAVPGTRYKAELDDRLNKKSIDIVELDPESVTVVIPTDMVSRGQYAVKLTITTPDGNEQERSYRFDVQ